LWAVDAQINKNTTYGKKKIEKELRADLPVKGPARSPMEMGGSNGSRRVGEGAPFGESHWEGKGGRKREEKGLIQHEFEKGADKEKGGGRVGGGEGETMRKLLIIIVWGKRRVG